MSRCRFYDSSPECCVTFSILRSPWLFTGERRDPKLQLNALLRVRSLTSRFSQSAQYNLFICAAAVPGNGTKVALSLTLINPSS